MKKNEKVSATVERITPAIAQRWLTENENSTFQRHISRAHVANLALEMKAGRWMLNGEAITFNGKVLLDGQHRLRAVVESGCSVPMLVVRGVSGDAFATYDQGKQRTPGDVLSMTGAKDANALAATLRFVWKDEQGELGRRQDTSRLPGEVVVALTRQHPDVTFSIQAVRRLKLYRMAPLAVLAFCHYKFKHKDAALADVFFDALATGERLDKGQPVYLLRERLQANAISRLKLPKPVVLGLIIKAWNGERTGKTIKALTFRDNEPFPEIA